MATTVPSGAPSFEVSARELLKLGRKVERLGVMRRRYLARVEELEGSIREARRLFRQLSEALMLPAAVDERTARGEDVP